MLASSPTMFDHGLTLGARTCAFCEHFLPPTLLDEICAPAICSCHREMRQLSTRSFCSLRCAGSSSTVWTSFSWSAVANVCPSYVHVAVFKKYRFQTLRFSASDWLSLHVPKAKKHPLWLQCLLLETMRFGSNGHMCCMLGRICYLGSHR